MFAAIILAVLPALASGCTVPEILECNALMKTAIAHPAGTFQSLGDPDYSQLCREAEQYKDCIDNLYSACDEETQLTFHGLLNVFDFMCNEERKIYLEHHECFGGRDLDLEGHTCLYFYVRKVQEIKANMTESTQSLDDVCSAYDDYKNCSCTAVDKFCGEEAMKFIDDELTAAFQPRYELYGCSPTSDRHMKKAKTQENRIEIQQSGQGEKP